MSDHHHIDPKQQQHLGWTGLRSSTNGTTFFKSNFGVFIAGQLVTVVAGVALFLITYGGFTERQRQIGERVARLEETTQRMDREGTNASKYGIKEELNAIQSNTSRIARLEEQSAKIDVMAEKIARIDDTVKRMDAISRGGQR
jgi:hypothetical protein